MTTPTKTNISENLTKSNNQCRVETDQPNHMFLQGKQNNLSLRGGTSKGNLGYLYGNTVTGDTAY